MVKTLAQLKRALTAGTEFRIVEHCRPEEIGKRRRVTYANTVGFYSNIPDEPDSKASQSNRGRGPHLNWSKAPFWEFRPDGVCALYSSDKNKTTEHIIVAVKLL